MDKVGILLVDRSKLFREGVKGLLAGSQFIIVAQAAGLEEAVQQIQAGLTPRLVLLDLDEGNQQQSDCMRQLRQGDRPAQLVVLTERMCPRRLSSALEAGADGYLLKDMSPDALKQSLNLVLLGEKVLPTDLARMLVSGQIGASLELQSNSHGRGLSDREAQILRCLLHGLSNKVIANRLNITEGTVKVHLKAVLKKINVSNRTQAAIWALNHGFGDEEQQARSETLLRAVSALPTKIPA
jgi:two-component system nitrate/nitrite response regulator NarL